MYGKHIYVFQRVHGCLIRSGRALAPQGFSLSFTDNVPFGDTSRAKGYSYICILIINPTFQKGKHLTENTEYFFYLFPK